MKRRLVELDAASKAMLSRAEAVSQRTLEQGSPSASTSAEGNASARRPFRILVIEDCIDTARSLRVLLELRGHQVEIAASGADGLAIARRFRPEVVLCDLGLPGDLDGYGVARTLRQEDDSVHLIALTGRDPHADQGRAWAAGFDLHLTKPVDFEDLVRVLASLLPLT